MIRKSADIDTTQMSDAQKQRIEEVYKRIHCLTPEGIQLKPEQEWVPAWSSYGLEQLIKKTLSSPEGCINDLFMGFWKALTETRVPLTQTMSYLIKDITIYSWHALRWKNNRKNDDWYRKEDYKWIISLVNKECTEAQAYFAMYVLSVDALTNCKETILQILEKTDFIEMARNMLSE